MHLIAIEWLVLLMLGAWPPTGFSSAGEGHGVHVYQRGDGHVIELAADGELAAPPAQVRRVLLDYAHHPRWVRNLSESRVIASGPDYLDVYQRLDLPLLDDRDFTLHVTWGQDGDALWVKFEANDAAGPPPQRGVVRVHVHDGEWRLEPRDDGRTTMAYYRFRLDLAGSLPSWMGRGRAAKDLPRFFENLRGQLPAYR